MRDFVRRVGKQVAEEKIGHLASGGSLADENQDLLSSISELVSPIATPGLKEVHLFTCFKSRLVTKRDSL